MALLTTYCSSPSDSFKLVSKAAFISNDYILVFHFGFILTNSKFPADITLKKLTLIQPFQVFWYDVPLNNFKDTHKSVHIFQFLLALYMHFHSRNPRPNLFIDTK